MLKVRDLSFGYQAQAPMLCLASLDVAAGEAVALVGPSGAGKTTLLKLIAGVLRAKAGHIGLDDCELTALSAGQRSRHRLAAMGVVFQDFALLDYLTVGENVLLPGELRGADVGAERDRALSLLDGLGVGHYWATPTARLSQGERQRVAIVRALVHRPGLILADEPTASLDYDRRDAAMELLLGDVRSRSACLLMVTHDAELLPLFDRVIRLSPMSGEVAK
jgi:putative ABC transport system ATP-binding protein